jgi:predicted acyltransferase (DUF342 family)
MVALLLLSAAALPAHALSSRHEGSGQDRVSFGTDITINEGETVGDVVCVFCSVHLRGDAHGDIVTIFGSLTLDQDRSVAGDVVVVAGDAALEENASVAGDLVLVAGDLHLSPDTSIHGDRVVLPGRMWLAVPFAPLLILIGLIWLIVWLIRRNRYQPRYYPPAPPGPPQARF